MYLKPENCQQGRNRRSTTAEAEGIVEPELPVPANLRSREPELAVTVNRWSQEPELAVTANIWSLEPELAVLVSQDTAKTVPRSGSQEVTVAAVPKPNTVSEDGKQL